MLRRSSDNVLSCKSFIEHVPWQLDLPSTSTNEWNNRNISVGDCLKRFALADFKRV
jgi:hypothetical protein